VSADQDGREESEELSQAGEKTSLKREKWDATQKRGRKKSLVAKKLLQKKKIGKGGDKCRAGRSLWVSRKIESSSSREKGGVPARRTSTTTLENLGSDKGDALVYEERVKQRGGVTCGLQKGAPSVEKTDSLVTKRHDLRKGGGVYSFSLEELKEERGGGWKRVISFK